MPALQKQNKNETLSQKTKDYTETYECGVTNEDFVWIQL